MPVRSQELQRLLVVSIASVGRFPPSPSTMRGCHFLVAHGGGHVEVAEIRLTSSCSRLGRISGRVFRCALVLSKGKHEDSSVALTLRPGFHQRRRYEGVGENRISACKYISAEASASCRYTKSWWRLRLNNVTLDPPGFDIRIAQ